mgnify:CR=1 FL=1
MSANERRKYERAKDPLRAMHERARDAGTECLATEWLGCSHHYRFRCPLGNEWLRTSNLQRRNARCLRCSRAEAGLAQRDAGIFDRIVQAAIDRGGACQTSNYQGAYARYNFVCASGHNWETHPLITSCRALGAVSAPTHLVAALPRLLKSGRRSPAQSA